MLYHKNPKNLDTRKICCNFPRIGTVLFTYSEIGPKDADRMANSVDDDQTASLGAVLGAVHCLLILVCLKI